MHSVKKITGFCLIWIIVLTFGLNVTAMAENQKKHIENKTETNDETPSAKEKLIENKKENKKTEKYSGSLQAKHTDQDVTTDVDSELKDPEEKTFSLDYDDQEILKVKNKAAIVFLEYVGDFSESEQIILSNRLKHIL